MSENKVYTVIGLMSGTSTDGVDAALMRTDGLEYAEPLDFISLPYAPELRDEIMGQFGKSVRDSATSAVEKEITYKHAEAVNALRHKNASQAIDLVGFHGQTIFHDPDNRKTLQIGDADLLARETGIDVVNDFRTADVVAGGQGAPLLPLYHQVIAQTKKLARPCVFLNIGGVSNLTYVGDKLDDVIAFDCGPGNALIDDVMQQDYGKPYDDNGMVAGIGVVEEHALQQLMSHPYFQKTPPKSLDRDAWNVDVLETLSPEDKISTLTEFTVEAIAISETFLPQNPATWYVCGGGRHNKTLMQRLDSQLVGDVKSIDVLGVDGDALEAEGFGYLAVRSLKKLPLSLPSTTGVPKPLTGGCYRRVA